MKPALASSIIFPVLVVALTATAWAGGPHGDDLAKQATIRRDAYGVPHILAETEEAAIFAYGYSVAEDRILALARLFLKARSEEAMYFGQEFAESDLMAKKLRIYDVAAENYDTIAPWYRRLLDAYAAGYNRYIARNRKDLPDWVKPVTGIDVLAHTRRVIVAEFDMNLRQIENIGRQDRAALDFPAPADVIGSNMWAIGKERSVSGNTILLGNPHLNWSGSHLWHEAHLTVPDKLNFMGGALIGFPHPALGWNDRLAWSHTVNPHDSSDVYELDAVAGRQPGYIYEGRPEPLRKVVNAIKVREGNRLVEKKEDVYWTHYGPVVKRIGDKIYAFKNASQNEYRFLEQWYLMTKAKSLAEFRAILDMQAIPMFNICYADADGNIFYLFNGRMPDRPQGYDWSGVVPGGTAATEWNRVLPQGRLPWLLNPAGGYVQNCNSAPWYTNLQVVIDKSAFPADLCPDENSLRTQHSLEMLESDPKLSLHEVMDYKFAMQILMADRVKSDLVKLAKGKTVDGVDLTEAAEVLERWDNTVARDSRGSVLFIAFVEAYRDATRRPYAEPWTPEKPASTPRGIGDPDASLRALAKAAGEVKSRYGALDVKWGDVHRLRRGDLDVPIGGAPGDYGAFRVVNYRPAEDGRRVAVGGDSYVFVVEFANPLRAHSILAYSQSDDPASPHHTDQSVLFARETWKPAWFSERDIEEFTERSYQP